MAGLFDKISKDVKMGIKEGIAVVKEGASVVSGKMSELTAEGKRQYKIFDLKAKIQNQMTELGGRAYDALNSKKSPAADARVKAIFEKIKKLEGQLCKLEGDKKAKASLSKKCAKKAAPKSSVRNGLKKAAAKTGFQSAAKK
ncbi:MAG: hypothetical protein A4E71_02330 [Smithella sp. PtaU1.Bin162]|nr:MAG: hypothetical protein A4E71_02330 [Smithella sp. PtaU1.Bin162]